jgi:hypothetical protein
MIYSICYANEDASSLANDVGRYVITRKLLDYTALNDTLHLLWERGCVIVSDVDRYVIIGELIRFYFQHTSPIHTPVGNSSTY